MTTKTITVFATSRANIEPGNKGYSIALSDPDAESGKPLAERTFASGYAVPVEIEVPTDWSVAEAGDGQEYLFTGGGTAMQLHWHYNKGNMAAWPAFATMEEAKKQGALTHVKAQKLTDVG